jgi:hypothetical protein
MNGCELTLRTRLDGYWVVSIKIMGWDSRQYVEVFDLSLRPNRRKFGLGLNISRNIAVQKYRERLS